MTSAWRELIVGQWWTPQSDLGIVGAAATKRRTTATAWQHFSDQLTQELAGSLNPELQKGMTADNIREAFKWGATQAGDVAETNQVIGKAHGSAHEWVTDLNSRLDAIANDGESRIKQIQDSKDLAPIKAGKIVEVVMDCQQQANAAAAPCTQNIFEAMQTILDRRGIPKSARQFAQEHGIDTTRMLGSPNKETVTEQVEGIFNQHGPPQAPAPNNPQQGLSGVGEDGPGPSPAQGLPTAPPPKALTGVGGDPPGAPRTGSVSPAANYNPPNLAGAGEDGPRILPPAAGGPALPGPAPSGNIPVANAPLPTNALSTGAPLNAFAPRL